MKHVAFHACPKPALAPPPPPRPTHTHTHNKIPKHKYITSKLRAGRTTESCGASSRIVLCSSSRHRDTHCRADHLHDEGLPLGEMVALLVPGIASGHPFPGDWRCLVSGLLRLASSCSMVLLAGWLGTYGALNLQQHKRPSSLKSFHTAVSATYIKACSVAAEQDLSGWGFVMETCADREQARHCLSTVLPW